MFTNEYYELDYVPAKNQINWKVKGYWPSVKVVPNMEKDWDAVLARARKPGFNILADLTEMQLAPQEVQDLHAKVQQHLIQAGVRKIAAITKSALLRMTVNNIGTVSGMKQLMGQFNDKAKAQAWLDEKV